MRSIARVMCYYSVMESITEKTLTNVYDFDKTIYDGDSTVDLYKYCVRHYPRVILRWPQVIFYAALYALRIISKTNFKEKFYLFLKDIPDIDRAVHDFWSMNKHKIKSWYISQKKDTDIISSASPEFNLIGICKELNVRLIASKVDKYTGIYTGINNHGEEKVVRQKEAYPDVEIDEFYSDSVTDAPLAHLANKAFLVKGNSITKWSL